MATGGVSGHCSFPASFFAPQPPQPLADAQKYLESSSSSSSGSDGEDTHRRSRSPAAKRRAANRSNAAEQEAQRARDMAVLTRQRLAAAAMPKTRQAAGTMSGVNYDRKGVRPLCLAAATGHCHTHVLLPAGDNHNLLYKSLFISDRLATEHRCGAAPTRTHAARLLLTPVGLWPVPGTPCASSPRRSGSAPGRQPAGSGQVGRAG
jgi:hypothetical protein